MISALYRQPRFGGTAGIVLIGHSIGGAIALSLAATQPRWPLLGIAISGLGRKPPPQIAAAWASLPESDLVSVPQEAKEALMFGPPGTFDSQIPALSRAADAPTPRAELIDIVTEWPRAMSVLAKKVAVPVHYRQAEFDKLWVVNETEIDQFATAFSSAPSVDSRIFESAGHCIDFHHGAAAFQLEQLNFALRCSTDKPVLSPLVGLTSKAAV